MLQNFIHVHRRGESSYFHTSPPRCEYHRAHKAEEFPTKGMSRPRFSCCIRAPFQLPFKLPRRRRNELKGSSLSVPHQLRHHFLLLDDPGLDSPPPPAAPFTALPTNLPSHFTLAMSGAFCASTFDPGSASRATHTRSTHTAQRTNETGDDRFYYRGPLLVSRRNHFFLLLSTRIWRFKYKE